MFADFVFEKAEAQYVNKLIFFDCDNIEKKTEYTKYFEKYGFRIVKYTDDLHFRSEYNEEIYCNDKKVLVLADKDVYVPYDILKIFKSVTISVSELFPKLNTNFIQQQRKIDFDLLTSAYVNNFDDVSGRADTEMFWNRNVLSKRNVKNLILKLLDQAGEKAAKAKNYKEWICVSELKTKINLLAAEYDIDVNTEEIDNLFTKWVLSDYGKLSQENNPETPVTVSRTMEYINEQSTKFVLIVMDGMSEFDWKILSASFDIHYKKSSVIAMIPTTTSVSRQCLLSNKFPSQLIEPWKQSKEKNEFSECAKRLGYAENQIAYARGYNIELSSSIKCAAVVINEIDDIVHGQQQGRHGMFNDIKLLAEKNKMVTLVKKLLSLKFDVYITADHGNTLCIGDGKLVNTGVEVETKSRRMLVLKDFASKKELMEKYHLIDYPKYYLDKKYDYLISPVGHSFDAGNAEVMTHGGITMDEIIVPFIKVEAGKNDG